MYERIGGACADLRQWALWPIPPASPPDSQYVVEAAIGTVKDTKTGLQWQKVLAVTTFTFDQAQSECAALSLDGEGWRVPHVKELNSLVDTTRSHPAIDVTAFPGTAEAGFWSSTLHVDVPNWAWIVDLRAGDANGYDVDKVAPVRCVR